jgi:hypothetical protein
MALSTALFVFGFATIAAAIFSDKVALPLVIFACLALVLAFPLAIWGGNAYSGEVSDNESVQQSSTLITAIGKAVGFARKGVPPT